VECTGAVLRSSEGWQFCLGGEWGRVAGFCQGIEGRKGVKQKWQVYRNDGVVGVRGKWQCIVNSKGMLDLYECAVNDVELFR